MSYNFGMNTSEITPNQANATFARENAANHSNRTVITQTGLDIYNRLQRLFSGHCITRNVAYLAYHRLHFFRGYPIYQKAKADYKQHEHA